MYTFDCVIQAVVIHPTVNQLVKRLTPNVVENFF